jgi:hypothetical protein
MAPNLNVLVTVLALAGGVVIGYLAALPPRSRTKHHEIPGSRIVQALKMGERRDAP